MQSKQYFTKIKNYPHEKSTEPIYTHVFNIHNSSNKQYYLLALFFKKKLNNNSVFQKFHN